MSDEETVAFVGESASARCAFCVQLVTFGITDELGPTMAHTKPHCEKWKTLSPDDFARQMIDAYKRANGVRP